MKAGTENKTKVWIAIVLAIVAILTLAWALMPAGAPKPEPATVVAAAPERAKTAKTTQASESLDPRLRLELLANSEDVKYEGTGTNIFRAGAETINIPKPIRSPLVDNHSNPSKPGYTPPPPPPITLKFFGMSNSRGEKPKVFLSQGDDVWIAHEGDVVDRHYKIVRISPTSVEVEDLLNNNRQSIQLTQG
jgi:hypothetical protein